MQKTAPDYKRDEAASPTVHNNAVMLTFVIDAHERRDVMILDVPGVFFACHG